jgi:hypothetical protein
VKVEDEEMGGTGEDQEASFLQRRVMRKRVSRRNRRREMREVKMRSAR